MNGKRKCEMCPAWGQVCSKCNNRNCYSWCCAPDVCSIVHVIDEQSSDVEYELYEDSILTVYSDESIRYVSTGPLYTEMMLPNKTAIKLQIDSGATVNVISAKHVDINNATSCRVKLKMYNTSLKLLGKCLLLIENPANGCKHCVELSRRTSSLYSAGEQPTTQTSGNYVPSRRNAKPLQKSSHLYLTRNLSVV